MLWSLEKLCRSVNENTVNINGKWVPSRPINWKHRNLKEKIYEAWMVFTGKAEPFTWPENQ